MRLMPAKPARSQDMDQLCFYVLHKSCPNLGSLSNIRQRDIGQKGDQTPVTGPADTAVVGKCRKASYKEVGEKVAGESRESG